MYSFLFVRMSTGAWLFYVIRTEQQNKSKSILKDVKKVLFLNQKYQSKFKNLKAQTKTTKQLNL